MKKLLLLAALAVASLSASAQKNPMVGGAPMYASKDIVSNAVNSRDHTVLVNLVKKAGLVETLQSPGPFTVFAPTDAAFRKVPENTLKAVQEPENKELLTTVLTYHVVPGRITSQDIAKMIKANKGRAMLKTVQGEELMFTMKGNQISVRDAKGGEANITIADVMQSNGVIHVVDNVLMP